MTVFWKQKWYDKFKVTHDCSFRLLLFPKIQNVRVCQDMCTNVPWGRRRFSTFETLVDVMHSLVRSCLNIWDDGLLRTNLLVDFYPRKLGKFFSFILRFLRFVRKLCTLALNYFIIWFLLLRFTVLSSMPEIQKFAYILWNARTFIPAVLPHKGQELQTTDEL